MTDRPIHLHYRATTPIDTRVLEAMLPYLTSEFGNPSSSRWLDTADQPILPTQPGARPVASNFARSPGPRCSTGRQSTPQPTHQRAARNRSGACRTLDPLASDQLNQNGCAAIPTTAGSKSSNIM